MHQKLDYHILVWLMKARLNQDGAPISIRLTISGKRTEFSIPHRIQLNQWDQQNQMVIGTARASQINAEIFQKKAAIEKEINGMIYLGQEVDLQQKKWTIS